MNCPDCNKKMSNGASINGKTQYFCINPECVDRFKTVSAQIKETDDRKET